MSTANPNLRGPYVDQGTDPFRWLGVALASLFVFIAVAVVVSVLVSATWHGYAMPYMGASPSWGPILAGLMVGIVLLVAFTLVGGVLWGLGSGGVSRRFSRRMSRWGYDPALEMARERFARGEISQAQFDQLATALFPDAPRSPR